MSSIYYANVLHRILESDGSEVTFQGKLFSDKRFVSKIIQRFVLNITKCHQESGFPERKFAFVTNEVIKYFKIQVQ